jgi:hypothetical protein
MRFDWVQQSLLFINAGLEHGPKGIALCMDRRREFYVIHLSAPPAERFPP